MSYRLSLIRICKNAMNRFKLFVIGSMLTLFLTDHVRKNSVLGVKLDIGEHLSNVPYLESYSTTKVEVIEKFLILNPRRPTLDPYSQSSLDFRVYPSSILILHYY